MGGQCKFESSYWVKIRMVFRERAMWRYGVSLVFKLVIPSVTEQLNQDCYYEWSDFAESSISAVLHFSTCLA